MHALRTPARSLLAAAGLTAVLMLSACGDDSGDGSDSATAEQAASVTVTDPWIRATEDTEDTSMTAAYMLLENDADSEATLVGADTEVAGRTEIHEMVEEDGEMLMRAIEGGLVLAPGRGLVLQPGGTHIMLMDVSTALKAGDEVTLTLEFDDGSTQELTVPVKPFTEETGHYHDHGDHDHGDHDHGDEGDHGDHEH